MLAWADSYSAHDRHCPVRISGTYEFAAAHKSHYVGYLYTVEHRLSEPEVPFTRL